MLLIVVGLAFFQYYTSDKLALRASGAKIVEPRGGARAARHGRAAVRDGRPAEAEGRDHRHAGPERFRDRPLAQARGGRVTTGLWNRLEPAEIEGVLAHELSHIANRDVLIMTVASFFAMLAAMLTRFGMYAGMFGGGGRDRDNGPPVWLIMMVVSIVVYALSYVLIRTISRYREFAADRGAAIITGAPEQLMSALQKISSQMTLIPQQDLREVEGMNAFFIIPAKAKAVAGELFASHPPLEKRLAALAEIARQMGRPVA